MYLRSGTCMRVSREQAGPGGLPGSESKIFEGGPFRDPFSAPSACSAKDTFGSFIFWEVRVKGCASVLYQNRVFCMCGFSPGNIVGSSRDGRKSPIFDTPCFLTSSVQETQEGRRWVHLFKSIDIPDRCSVTYCSSGFVSMSVLRKKWSFLDLWDPQNLHTFGHVFFRAGVKKPKFFECSQRVLKCVVTGRSWTHEYSWVEELGFLALNNVGLSDSKSKGGGHKIRLLSPPFSFLSPALSRPHPLLENSNS